jgi:hypothetical protein
MKKNMICPDTSKLLGAGRKKADEENKGKNEKQKKDQIEVQDKGEKKKNNKAVLEKLYDMDRELFKPGGVENKKYASSCQASDGRQPVIFSDLDIAYNQKCFPRGITSHVKYGSDQEKISKNNYLCPQVWCPESKVSMSLEQFNKLGKKCPFDKVNEEPYVFVKANYWKDKNDGTIKERYINFLAPSNHPKGLCLPCCGITPLKDSNKCLDIVGDEKYIKVESFPSDESRYNLIPVDLAQLFENKVCGNKDGGYGVINKQTNCYLKYGIKPTNQYFLESLNVSKDEFNKIISKMTITDYMFLNGGKTVNEFMPLDIDMDSNDIIVKFKKWFNSDNKEIKAYKKQFNLDYLDKFVELYAKKTDMPYENDIEREILYFSSFLNFKEYSINDSVVKTHYTYLDVVKPKNINIIVFEYDGKKTTVSCNSNITYNTENKFKFLIKYRHYYEPIHHIEYVVNQNHKTKKGSYVYTELHKYDNPIIKSLIDFNVRSCTDSSNNFQKVTESYNPSYVVLNYNHTVYGLYLKENILLPITINNIQPSKFKFIYIDKLLKDHKTTIDTRVLQKYLESLGLEKKVAHKHEDYWMLSNHKVIPIRELDSKTIPEIDDIAIYIQKVKTDERILYMDRTRKIELLYQSFLNHVINSVDKTEIQFLRHMNNPMPKNVKRAYLRKILDLDFVKAYTNKNSDIPEIKHDNLCFNFKNARECSQPCAWIVTDKKQTCKLKVETSLLDSFVDKVIEELLNPVTKLKHTYFAKVNKSNDTIIFTNLDTSTEAVLKQIKEPHKYAYNFNEISYHKTVDTSKNVFDVNKLFDLTNHKNLPTCVRKLLHNMDVYVQPKSSKNPIDLTAESLFDIKLVADKDVEKMRELGRKIEINVLAIGINTIIPGCKMCYSKKEYKKVLIFCANKEDGKISYHPVLNAKGNFVVDVDTLSPDMQSFISKACKPYSLQS